jgi:hypothetical protein
LAQPQALSYLEASPHGILFFDMRRFAVISIACLAVLLGAGCLKTSPKKTPEPAVSAPSALENIPFQKFDGGEKTVSEAPKDLEIPPEKPDVKSGETASASQNVIVSSIVNNQALSNPFVLLGRARAFESRISWRVRDGHDRIVAEGSALTNAPEAGTYGQFRVRAFYERIPETDAGTVEVFTLSPANGVEQDLVSIPVKLETRLVSLKVFFSNIKEDLQTTDCARVHSTARRVPLTENVAEAAILELLKGPTAAERTLGFRTSIYPGAALRSIAVKDGMATVDFSKEFLYAVSGSCHLDALKAQVEQTLKQYPAVMSVKRLVEGRDAADQVTP